MMRESFVDVPRGGRLRCRIEGPPEGPALLLIRPLGGTIALWRGLVAALDPGLRVIAFDPAGVGGSDASVRVTVGGLAADAIAVLDACGVERAAVLGQSLGGFVALHLAARSPERVQKLLLVSTARRGVSFSRLPVRRGLLSARCMLARPGEVEVCLLRHTLQRDFARSATREVFAIEASLRAEPTPRTTLLQHDVAALLYTGGRDAKRVRCPSLLVAGSADDLLGTEPQRELASTLGAELVTLARVGHDVSLEAPDALASVVNAALTRGALR